MDTIHTWANAYYSFHRKDPFFTSNPSQGGTVKAFWHKDRYTAAAVAHLEDLASSNPRILVFLPATMLHSHT